MMKNSVSLNDVTQREAEPFWHYIARFTKVSLILHIIEHIYEKEMDEGCLGSN